MRNDVQGLARAPGARVGSAAGPRWREADGRSVPMRVGRRRRGKQSRRTLRFSGRAGACPADPADVLLLLLHHIAADGWSLPV
ncbi:hypothetical protein AB0M25_30510, partial [Streptomyces griseomycini]|uniref:hypothetical protein n=1 Tax=Streptomyces griseomycini TaxID=66895 RepID=UPI0034151A0A